LKKVYVGGWLTKEELERTKRFAETRGYTLFVIPACEIANHMLQHDKCCRRVGAYFDGGEGGLGSCSVYICHDR